MDISLYKGPAGEPGRGLVYRGLRKMNEGGLWKRNISLLEHYEVNLEGGLLYWGPPRYGSGNGRLLPCGPWGEAPFLGPSREG